MTKSFFVRTSILAVALGFGGQVAHSEALLADPSKVSFETSGYMRLCDKAMVKAKYDGKLVGTTVMQATVLSMMGSAFYEGFAESMKGTSSSDSSDGCAPASASAQQKAQKYINKQLQALTKAQKKGVLVNIDSEGKVTPTKTRASGSTAPTAKVADAKVEAVDDPNASFETMHQLIELGRQPMQPH